MVESGWQWYKTAAGDKRGWNKLYHLLYIDSFLTPSTYLKALVFIGTSGGSTTTCRGLSRRWSFGEICRIRQGSGPVKLIDLPPLLVSWYGVPDVLSLEGSASLWPLILYGLGCSAVVFGSSWPQWRLISSQVGSGKVSSSDPGFGVICPV
ncbi:hypothetical protein Bca52824_058331 [Brassica carinata]|uniref:Uncharacterized protein n=1 Tax=Brassica carinata TaxID=52824 RepID=A0A8X7UFK3_BRACI|nr:hypothetical protein Bca52824_058331 [Brassica carinata]